jgi:hypothetical protein
MKVVAEKRVDVGREPLNEMKGKTRGEAEVGRRKKVGDWGGKGKQCSATRFEVTDRPDRRSMPVCCTGTVV